MSITLLFDWMKRGTKEIIHIRLPNLVINIAIPFRCGKYSVITCSSTLVLRIYLPGSLPSLTLVHRESTKDTLFYQTFV